jgi:hypothetical protein
LPVRRTRRAQCRSGRRRFSNRERGTGAAGSGRKTSRGPGIPSDREIQAQGGYPLCGRRTRYTAYV